jgi:hypothetical protein
MTFTKILSNEAFKLRQVVGAVTPTVWLKPGAISPIDVARPSARRGFRPTARFRRFTPSAPLGSPLLRRWAWAGWNRENRGHAVA